VKVTCTHCKKIYNIPDERLPKKDSVSFPCPACKGIIDIKLNVSEPDSTASLKKEPQDMNTPANELADQNRLGGDLLKKRILRKVQALPPMPQTIFKAREILADPDSSFSDLAKVIEVDQSLTARVLKLANSAYYGMVSKVSSLQHASVVLGYKTIGELVTLASSSSILGKTLEGYGLDAGSLWQHSLAVGFGAKFIANKMRPEFSQDAFTSGLLHDIGKIVLDPYVLDWKDKFEPYLNNNKDFLNAEKDILGFDHCEIAAELCDLWKIPKALVNAINYHHYPSRLKNSDDPLADMVHIADVAAMMTGLGAGIDGLQYTMDEKAMQRLGINEDLINEISCEAADSVNKLSQNMNL